MSIEFFEVFGLWYDYTANAYFVEELDRFIGDIRESIQEYEDERGCSTLPCMEMTVIEKE